MSKVLGRGFAGQGFPHHLAAVWINRYGGSDMENQIVDRLEWRYLSAILDGPRKSETQRFGAILAPSKTVPRKNFLLDITVDEAY